MAQHTFQKYLDDNGLDFQILFTREPTKTAIQAASVHNVPVSNIVKSLLVVAKNRYYLFLVPGDRKLDMEEVGKRLKTEDVRMATADEVKDITGYSIGGVPPFGHKVRLETYIEDGFDSNRELVAAAGSGNSVFKISYEQLQRITNSFVV